MVLYLLKGIDLVNFIINFIEIGFTTTVQEGTLQHQKTLL